ncbi:MAG: hypothetical protein UHS41_08430 [Lachnospiraceae bacterium]|nr:hypothetical protein [Lachnospiraceae bacterium]
MNQDTVRLLQECNAGAKMGIKTLNEVLENVCDSNLKQRLMESRSEHEKIKDQSSALLSESHEMGKEPDFMASAMSWAKTNVKMAMKDSDQTIANLITDGCNMGITSLNRYLNQYNGAEYQAKSVVQDLIGAEEKLVKDLRKYL